MSRQLKKRIAVSILSILLAGTLAVSSAADVPGLLKESESVTEKEPLVLSRDQAYIGVLIELFRRCIGVTSNLLMTYHKVGIDLV